MGVFSTMIFSNEIVEKYGVSLQTIKRRIKEGKLNPIKIGNKNAFDEEEVKNLFIKKEEDN